MRAQRRLPDSVCTTFPTFGTGRHSRRRRLSGVPFKRGLGCATEVDVRVPRQGRLSLVLAGMLVGGCGDDARAGGEGGHDTEAVDTSAGPGGTSPSGGTPSTGANTEGDTADSEDSTNSASGADTQTPGDTDTDTNGEVDYPDDGYVSVVWTQADDDPAEAFLIGQLYEIVEPGVAAVEFAQPQGVDHCALTLYTLAELQQGSLPTYEHQSAGPLGLTWGEPPIEIAPTGAPLLYHRTLDPSAIAFGGAYHVDAPGDSFPAFSGSIDMPPTRQLLAPSPGFTTDGALTVRWSGGAPNDELLLRLEGMNDMGDRALVLCRLDNDGQHAVPEEIIEQLPSGRLSVHLEQRHRTHVVIGDRAVRLTGAVVHIVVGSTP